MKFQSRGGPLFLVFGVFFDIRYEAFLLPSHTFFFAACEVWGLGFGDSKHNPR